MGSTSKIPLTDYSNKYRVSISTLRRRIKANLLDFELKDGKYYIIDAPIHKPSKKKAAEPSTEEILVEENPTEEIETATKEALDNHDEASEDTLNFKNVSSLIEELKKAYTKILQEREEQIIQLKQEVAGLKTLVRVLEHKPPES